jgi:hypothetical protein
VRPNLNVSTLVLLGAIVYGCTVKDYPFFEDGTQTGGSPSCVGEACGNGGTVTSAGGATSTGGDGIAGASEVGGMAGEPSMVPEDCRIEETGALAERIQAIDSGLCFGRGEFNVLVGAAPSYWVELVACSTNVKQMWTIQELEPDVLEVRNYSVDMNLDVQYAGTATWTPVDIFQPIPANTNQRFNVVAIEEDTFRLVPQNAPTMCVSSWDGKLVLRPCDPTYLGQTFQRISCK